MGKVIISTSKTEKGFSANCELLPGWVVAFIGNFTDFAKYVQDSVDFYIECAREDGRSYPKIFDNQYVLEYKMNIQTILYCYDKIITRAALSRLTGINERQLGHYICGRSRPMKKQQDKIVNALHSLGKELQSVTA